jgi:hypothetical protein
MFYEKKVSSTKRATAAQALQVIDEMCKRLKNELHPVVLGQLVVDLSSYFGWDVRDLAQQATLTDHF